MLLPPLLQPAAERGKPLAQRFWVKANLWIAIFSFIGNYFWTHYFYRLLGAAYTFPAHRLNEASCRRAALHAGRLALLAAGSHATCRHAQQLSWWWRAAAAPCTLRCTLASMCCPSASSTNISHLPTCCRPASSDVPPPCDATPPPPPVCLQVPITLYFMTHAYFCLYHALSNMLIRRVRHALAARGPTAQVGRPPASPAACGRLLLCRQDNPCTLPCCSKACRMPPPGCRTLACRPPWLLAARPPGLPPQAAAEAVLVFVLAYATAFGETLTIAHFPYYSFKVGGP